MASIMETIMMYIAVINDKCHEWTPLMDAINGHHQWQYFNALINDSINGLH